MVHQSHGWCIHPNELCLLMQHQPTLKQMVKKASKLAQKAVKEAAVQPLLPAPEQMFGKTMDMPLTSSASRPLAFTPPSGINFRPSICLLAGHLQERTDRLYHLVYQWYHLVHQPPDGFHFPLDTRPLMLQKQMITDYFWASRLALFTRPRWLVCRGNRCCHVYVCLVVDWQSVSWP